jgi:hypothetical protein
MEVGLRTAREPFGVLAGVAPPCDPGPSGKAISPREDLRAGAILTAHFFTGIVTRQEHRAQNRRLRRRTDPVHGLLHASAGTGGRTMTTAPGQPRVLIVEDDESVRMLLRDICEEYAWNVVTAANRADANLGAGLHSELAALLGHNRPPLAASR